MVDEDAFLKRKKDKSIPLAEVVDDFRIFKYDTPGTSGNLTRPSNREIEDIFGTTRDDMICDFMMEKGHLKGGRMM